MEKECHQLYRTHIDMKVTQGKARLRLFAFYDSLIFNQGEYAASQVPHQLLKSDMHAGLVLRRQGICQILHYYVFQRYDHLPKKGKMERQIGILLYIQMFTLYLIISTEYYEC